VDQHVHAVHTFFVEELEEADRAAARAVTTVAVSPTGEGEGIGAVGVGLLGEEEKGIPPGAGEDGRVEQRGPAGGEDRHR
jgi:hypothetical protein